MNEGSGLRPLEIASGLVLGLGRGLEDDAVNTNARAALERTVLEALHRPPCLVSFSGGRDSSAILAIAVDLARRAGLPLPVPATHRFASVAASVEDEWQERVVRHLGLDDWARLEHEDEIDCVGPVAARVLLEHGLLWPFNAHFHLPLLELASGGSLLTGIGGDELLTGSRWSGLAHVLLARARPTPRDVLRLGYIASPPALRRRALAGDLPLPFPWLRPAARRELSAVWAAHGAAEPLRWVAHLRWVRRLRYLEVGTDSLTRLAGDEVRLHHPFLDASFARALARLPRTQRFTGRTALMERLVGDLLPTDVLTRASKATFDAAFWNVHSRAFAAEWDGSGVDEDVVDVDALRAEWASEEPDPRTFTLVQSAWLSSRSRAGGPLRPPVSSSAEGA
jgi:asparagine synthetase B (glutamine-hydrolysing)